MTDAKSAWHETGERFSGLGAKLKLHYEQQRGQEADQAKAEVREALQKLTGALEDAFEAIGTAARDDTVKSDVKQVGQSLVTALGATFSQISAEVQRQFASRSGGSGRQSAAGTPPAADAEATTVEPAAGAEAATTAPAGEPPAAGSEPSTTAGPPASPTEGPAEDDGGTEPPKVEPWGTP
jgi:Flp pilus assembly pilin Flp